MDKYKILLHAIYLACRLWSNSPAGNKGVIFHGGINELEWGLCVQIHLHVPECAITCMCRQGHKPTDIQYIRYKKYCICWMLWGYKCSWTTLNACVLHVLTWWLVCQRLFASFHLLFLMDHLIPEASCSPAISNTPTSPMFSRRGWQTNIGQKKEKLAEIGENRKPSQWQVSSEKRRGKEQMMWGKNNITRGEEEKWATSLRSVSRAGFD